MKHYKITYHNFQHYETKVFAEYLEKQSQMGYLLCGVFGVFGNILKFHYSPIPQPQHYLIYRKNTTAQIDKKIKQLKNRYTIACENNYLVIFSIPLDVSLDINKNESQHNTPPKKFFVKTALTTFLLFILTIIFIAVQWLKRNSYSQLYSFFLWTNIALVIIFLFYFTGDFYDIVIKKKGLKKPLSIIGRTPFKNFLFKVGDICKLGIFLTSIYISAVELLSSPSIVNVIQIIGMWFVFCITFSLYRLKLKGSYIYLLWLTLFLSLLNICSQ